MALKAVLRKFSSARVIFTGAAGQIGSKLLTRAQQTYGIENVLATDLKQPPSGWEKNTRFEQLDVLNNSRIEELFSSYRPTIIYHLASTLSAPSELNPQLALKVNIQGLHNILEQARIHNSQIFVASSLAAFGSSTPKIPGNLEIQRPSTIYGITKVHLELIGEYYNMKHGVDFRSLRIPVITSEGAPGGGSAAFTVTMFYDLLSTGKTIIPVSPDTKMPLMYLDDLIDGVSQFMQAPNERLTARTYTMASCGVSASDYCNEVLRWTNGEVEYKPDYRDPIVKSWPDGTDWSAAERDWGHRLKFDMKKMVKTMYEKLTNKK
ncbi:unnamed protein product [Blepharisma stoltei]|uniref:NAD-dependent epimerase/dehydratase domain-containing protein n=1 Tax=Blepharisma stoltei TaxID=1481888 RepID=A0AAU9IVL4_9CILI|nr:unnamed protein product [Blepharisma stoltei]